MYSFYISIFYKGAHGVSAAASWMKLRPGKHFINILHPRILILIVHSSETVYQTSCSPFVPQADSVKIKKIQKKNEKSQQQKNETPLQKKINK